MKKEQVLEDQITIQEAAEETTAAAVEETAEKVNTKAEKDVKKDARRML